jgi:lysophospholipid acyltransferase (LPLAT)-like uncharacterized protein
VVLGATCRPALAEPHKWDQPRNPVPFGKIAIAVAEPLLYQDFPDAAAVESARQNLAQRLDETSSAVREALGL